jgi:hypothetical protein
MADFVAVIKRAVDGLSDQSPAMRQRVYEKARMAVRRQLEGMSPRPSEQAIEAQLAKLETAVNDVEADFAEPVLTDGDFVFDDLEPAPPPAGEAVSHREPEAEAPAEEQDEARDEEPAEAFDDPAHEPAGMTSEPVGAEPPDWSADVDPAPQPVDDAEPEERHAADEQPPADQEPPAYEEPADHDAPDGEDASDAAADEPEAPAEPAFEPDVASRPAGPAPVPFGSYAIGRAPTFPARVNREADAERAERGGFQPSRYQTGFGKPPEREPEPEPEPTIEPEAEAPASEIAGIDESAGLPDAEPVSAAEMDTGSGEPAVSLPEPEPVAAITLDHEAETAPTDMALPGEPSHGEDLAGGHEADWRRPEFSDTEVAAVEPQGMSHDELPPAYPGEDEWSPAETSSETQAPREANAADAGAAGGLVGLHDFSAPPDNQPPGESVESIFEDELRSQEAGSATDLKGATHEFDAGSHDAAFGFSGRDDRLAEAPAPRRAIRTGSPRSGSGRKRIAIGLLALLLIGGAGYAAWSNQDALMAMFSPSDTATDVADGDAAPQDVSPEGEEDVAAVPPETADEAPEPEQEDAAPTPAPQKFTQRLLPNGTEVDDGPAPLAVQPTPGEGRSLAVQTDEEGGGASTGEEAAPDDAPPGATITEEEIAQSEAADSDTVESAQAETSAAADADQPLGVGQSMFLYEERLGQRGPTALEGSVLWRIVSESPGGDAQPEAAIRGEINVPEKNLTALITIKRNADTSLPASHLIEIVFSLPANFEGGGIETVQRVAFKATEEDRGNELIAVPAKITDDFFMVALNDYAEAVSANLQLMREREWIDIPVVYGNGRRALITLDKGSQGVDIFNRALSEWQRRTGGSAG